MKVEPRRRPAEGKGKPTEEEEREEGPKLRTRGNEPSIASRAVRASSSVYEREINLKIRQRGSIMGEEVKGGKVSPRTQQIPSQSRTHSHQQELEHCTSHNQLLFL